MKVGLNLGCGTRIFKSIAGEINWCNLDAVAGPGVDVVADWRILSAPWDDVTIRNHGYDLIVAHHTFEHQGCGDQPIRQCYDVLKPGGSLIVAVPDLRKLAKMWEREEISTQIYMTNVFGPYDGTEESRHRWGFDRTSLVEALYASAKWDIVDTFDFRKIPGADIARDDRWILCLEAVK